MAHDSETNASVEIELSPCQLLEAVSSAIGRDVSRSALYRWRKKLNMIDPPFGEGQVIALVKYGQLLSIGCKPNAAKEKTLAYLESHGL